MKLTELRSKLSSEPASAPKVIVSSVVELGSAVRGLHEALHLQVGDVIAKDYGPLVRYRVVSGAGPRGYSFHSISDALFTNHDLIDDDWELVPGFKLWIGQAWTNKITRDGFAITDIKRDDIWAVVTPGRGGMLRIEKILIKMLMSSTTWTTTDVMKKGST